MLGNGHVRFGGRDEETDQPRRWHRASSRPNTGLMNLTGWPDGMRVIIRKERLCVPKMSSVLVAIPN